MADRLVARGWQVEDRNWRGGRGELDLVVHHQGRIRFVEVKARAPDDPVGLEAIDRGKRRRLVSAARAWLLDWDDLVDEACFMVALVTLPPDGQPLETATVEWLDNAFDV